MDTITAKAGSDLLYSVLLQFESSRTAQPLHGRAFSVRVVDELGGGLISQLGNANVWIEDAASGALLLEVPKADLAAYVAANPSHESGSPIGILEIDETRAGIAGALSNYSYDSASNVTTYDSAAATVAWGALVQFDGDTIWRRNLETTPGKIAVLGDHPGHTVAPSVSSRSYRAATYRLALELDA
jgi:hypothetical protein